MQELALPASANSYEPPKIKLPGTECRIDPIVVQYHTELLNSDPGLRLIVSFVIEVMKLKNLPWQSTDGEPTRITSDFIDAMCLYVLSGFVPTRAPSSTYEIRKILTVFNMAPEQVRFILEPVVSWYKMWSYCTDPSHLANRPTK